MRGAIVLWALVSCAHTQPATDVGAANAVADAVKLIRAGRLDEAERRLAVEREAARAVPRQLEQVDYYLATVLAYRGNLQGAEHLVAAHLQAADGRGDGESSVWMASSLAWLLWARGELEGAIEAVERGASARGLDSEARRVWSERLSWERAFFLVDAAAAAPEDKRDAARRDADEAFRALDQPGAAEPDSRTALAAYAQLRGGDAAGAVEIARKVHLDADSDPTTAFAVALVLDAGGDAKGAAHARDQVSAKVGLLTPLFTKRL
jgi:hypothetical protein